MTVAQAERRLNTDALDLFAARRSFITFLNYVTIPSDSADESGEIVNLKPFPYQREIARMLEKGDSLVWLKRRQIGATKALLAPYALWRASFFPNQTGGIISKGQEEAKAFIRRMRAIHDTLPRELQMISKPGAERCEFRSGSEVIGFPSTEFAGVSYTFSFFIADEADVHPYGRANYDQYKPAIGDRQFIAASTANPKMGKHGFLNWLWEESEKGNLPYRPVFSGARCRPDQGEDFLNRERAAFGDERAFRAAYPRVPEDAFAGREGLVYESFDRDIHVKKPEVPWERCSYRVAAYDLGGGSGGDPTAMLFLGVYKGRSGKMEVHQYGEQLWKGGLASVDELQNALIPWHRRAPISWVCPDPVGTGQIVATSLAGLGWKVIPMNKIMKGKTDGINVVHQFLQSETYHLSPECEQTATEFESYYWMETTNPQTREVYTTKTPIDHHSDCLDALRYGLVPLWYREWGQPKTRVAFKGLKLVK